MLLHWIAFEYLAWWYRREARVALERERYLAHELIASRDPDPRYGAQLQREIGAAQFCRQFNENKLTLMGLLP